MLQIWRITPTRNLRLETEASTLDEVTQRLPEGYYSTFRTFDGGTRVLHLTSHLRRLYEPVSTPEVNASALRGQLRALLSAYPSGEARVRVVMTRDGQAYIVVAPLAPLPREIYENGVRVETTELERQDPRLKSTRFIGRSDSERRHLAEEGIFEALLVKDKEILEGMTSNFFYILQTEQNERWTSSMNVAESGTSTAGKQALPSGQRDAILGTAHENILLGVTRVTILEIARGMGLTVTYQPLRIDLLQNISEAFITSSSRGVVPVVKIDRVTIGQGNPGPITKGLMVSYDSYVFEKAEKI